MKNFYVNMFWDLENFVEGKQGGYTFFVASRLHFARALQMFLKLI